MRLKNIRPLLAALALATLMASAQAAPKPATTKAATPAAPVVKLGAPLLEEYHGGDPASRTTIYRGGESAKKPAPAAKQKPQS